jgi:putative intracellular protease/amidase
LIGGMKKGHPKVLVAVAHGCEDTETITIIDVLRRADAEVVVAKVFGIEDKNPSKDWAPF